MKTIGYFGDSFCASDRRTSWCRLLANKINRKVVHFGKPGGSVWEVFMEIEKLIRADNLPDTLFFCYTNPYRLYHEQLSLQPGATAPKDKFKEIYDAANRYYVYLQNKRQEDLRYEYALRYFDQQVLGPLCKTHEIIQVWSMDPTATITGLDINLETGLFLDESLLRFAYENVGKGPDFVFPPSWENHLTEKGNLDLANHLYEKIKTYVDQT